MAADTDGFCQRPFPVFSAHSSLGYSQPFKFPYPGTSCPDECEIHGGLHRGKGHRRGDEHGAYRRSDHGRPFLGWYRPHVLEPRRRQRRPATTHIVVGHRPDLCAPERRDGRRRDLVLGGEIPLRVLAPDHGDPTGGHREPRSAKSSRPAKIWVDTDRVQLCATLSTYTCDDSQRY